MATRMQQRRGTAAQWTSANPVLAAGEIGFEIDTNKFKLGDGINQWADLSYFVDENSLGGSFEDYVPLTEKGAADGVATLDSNGQVPISQLGNLIADAPELLNTLEEIAAALGDDADFASKVVPIVKKTTAEWEADTSIIPLGTIAYNTTVLGLKVGNGINDFAGLEYLMNNAQVAAAIQNSVDGLLEDSEFTGDIILPSSTTIGVVTSEEIGYLSGVSGSIQGQIDTLTTSDVTINTRIDTVEGDIVSINTEISSIDGTVGTLSSDLASLQSDLTTKADTASPTFTGDVVLPTTTSIGDVSSDEIGYLNGVTSGIQGQLDNKADSATVSTTYAPINNPTFTGDVVLPSTTTIGNVSSTELGHISTVTSNVQDQLDDKAPLESPTFTGTVSGVTAAMVGLGNVDNTSDEDKPISTATQAALDDKADLAGATFSGDVVVEGNLTVSGTTTTVNASELVVSDPLVYMADGQYAEDVLDVGFLAATGVAGGTEQDHLHSGFFRDVSDGKKWKLVSNVPHPVNNVVDVTNATRETLVVGNLEATGVVFSDGTQTKQGVPSITAISQKTDSYTLGALTERDTIIEMNKSTATTLTIPSDATLNFPVGTTLDVIQTGAGQVTIAGAGGVTVNATPGLKLRTQWSTVTLLKRAANTWLAFGDLTA